MEDAAIGFVVVLVGFLLFGAGFGMATSIARKEAIERGYASYCPQNGEWAWNGECAE